MLSNKNLHVFGQWCWHDEVYVVGNLDALLALRKAIDEALNTGVGVAEASTSDGEGFEVYVARMDSSAAWEVTKRPYYGEDSVDRREDALHPSSLPLVHAALRARNPAHGY